MKHQKVLEVKIKPPVLSKNILYRSRVKRHLDEVMDHRLTILQAGAGYGKSTALAALAKDIPQCIWYQISEEDQDLLTFLLNLCHATQFTFSDIKGLPIQLLETWDSSLGQLNPQEIVSHFLNAIGSCLEQDTLVVFEDLHMISNHPQMALVLDKIIGLAPSNLHFVASTRQVLQLPNLFRWKSIGQVQILDQSILIFSEEEISDLFSKKFNIDLSQGEIEDLFELTEGWAISLQLVGQSLKRGTINSIEEVLSRRRGPLESLFDVLAKDILEGQTADMREFMGYSSILRTMEPDLCDWLLESEKSSEKLQYLKRNDLFVTELGEGEFRFHPIFQQYLIQQIPPETQSKLHTRAAEFYTNHEKLNSAIFHYIEAKDYFKAAELLDKHGAQLHKSGATDTMAGYLDNLSPESLSQFPNLLHYLGDIARFHSRFEEALGWYQQAETLWRERGQVDGISRALRGQARIYLDTVNPSKAEELLQEALRLSDRIKDRETKARLYQLLAENKLNLGKVEDAEKLRKQADVLRHEGPDDSQLWFRVLLRTGRLAEASKQLEIKAKEETSEPFNIPRSHRETQLLLSIIYAMQGEYEHALDSANEGVRRGKDLSSPFITAVGLMRKGHALMLKPFEEGYSKAEKLFEQVVDISEDISTPRLRVEALWGLVRVKGYQGNLSEALLKAEKGIGIASQAGDEWIASLTSLTMGISYVLAEEYPSAAEWLDRAIRGFQECSDPFGVCAVRLWKCLMLFKQSELNRLNSLLRELFSVCNQKGFDFLLTRISLLGMPDEKMIVPLLIWARENGVNSEYSSKLLDVMGLNQINSHPGFQLRINTLGSFQVWRGGVQIYHKEWRREKTRLLFQLLITFRQSPLDREQICEYLWPGVGLEAALKNFKVALNNLYSVLEPDRKPGDESAFVLREGTVYGLRPDCDVWIDADEFEDIVLETENIIEEDPDQALNDFEKAMKLYKGEYLPDARYLVWPTIEREHLAVLYLKAADKFCELNLKKRNFDKVIEESQRILAYDSCWERAYRHLMSAYDGLGDHGQVARVYIRCVDILNTDLNVKPSHETVSLYKILTNDE